MDEVGDKTYGCERNSTSSNRTNPANFLKGCFLLFLEKYDQILAAFIIATFFVVASREQQIHYTPDMDRVYHFCTWQPGLCVVALVIMDWFRAVSHDNFEHRENALSIVLIAANVGILGICGLSVDHKRR